MKGVHSQWGYDKASYRRSDMTIGHFQSTLNISKGLPVGIAALSNQTSSHVDIGVLVHAGITFHPDGQVYDLGTGIMERALFVGGEWYPLEPVTNIGAFYDVRWESLFSGVAFDFQAASVGTWIDISAERIWRNTRASMSSPGTTTTSGYFEVRTTGVGTYIDRAIYTATAQN